MRRPPPLGQIVHFPVTGGTAALAIAATLALEGRVKGISNLMAGHEIRTGELWRLLTSALPHGDFIHLAFNVYWLWVFGTLVESRFGSVATLLLFSLLAAGSQAAEFAVLEGGIGLSGVGYGLFGMLWVLSRRDHRFDDAVDSNTVSLFVTWFFICIGLTITDLLPVANIAHGVGAVLGALVGWAIARPGVQRTAAIVSILLVFGLSVASATVGRGYVNLSNDARGEAYLGYRALAEERNEDALKWLQDAVRIQPRDGGNWFNLGLTYMRLGRKADAEAAARKAAEIEPDNSEFRDFARSFD